jgi:hypothetical protein
MRRSILTCVFVAALTATTHAETQPTPAVSRTGASTAAASNATGPTVWGILPWGGFGIGGRYMIPLGIPGVVHSSSVHDAFAVEVGADYLTWNHDYVDGNYAWSEILAVGGFMWSFWLTDSFALYPKADLGYAMGWYSGYKYPGRPAYGGLFLSGDAGAIYRLGGGLSVRGELGTDGLKAGVAWLF